jgi:hypothetical protein
LSWAALVYENLRWPAVEAREPGCTSHGRKEGQTPPPA